MKDSKVDYDYQNLHLLRRFKSFSPPDDEGGSPPSETWLDNEFSLEYIPSQNNFELWNPSELMEV